MNANFCLLVIYFSHLFYAFILYLVLTSALGGSERFAKP